MCETNEREIKQQEIKSKKFIISEVCTDCCANFKNGCKGETVHPDAKLIACGKGRQFKRKKKSK